MLLECGVNTGHLFLVPEGPLLLMYDTDTDYTQVRLEKDLVVAVHYPVERPFQSRQRKLARLGIAQRLSLLARGAYVRLFCSSADTLLAATSYDADRTQVRY
jgi:hypothetical protein